MLFLCVSVYCHRVTTQLQLINIIIIIITLLHFHTLNLFSFLFVLPVGFNSPNSSESSRLYKYGSHCIKKIIIVNMSLGTPYMCTGSGVIVPPILMLGPRLGLSVSRAGWLIMEEKSPILRLNRRLCVHSLCYFMGAEDFVMWKKRSGSEAE